MMEERTWILILSIMLILVSATSGYLLWINDKEEAKQQLCLNVVDALCPATNQAVNLINNQQIELSKYGYNITQISNIDCSFPNIR